MSFQMFSALQFHPALRASFLQARFLKALDLLPIIDSLNCHPCSSQQGYARFYNRHQRYGIAWYGWE